MVTFKNVTHRPLLVEMASDAFVVFPGRMFNARPNQKAIRRLLSQNKIVRV